MGTEYRFDGLDKWEKELAKAIEQQYPEEFRRLVTELALHLEGEVKGRTPVDTGHLRDNWHVGPLQKRGNEYYIEVYNNVEYAEPVEYGHRRGRSFVPGRHMMELSLIEVQSILPDYLRSWLDDFLANHEII